MIAWIRVIAIFASLTGVAAATGSAPSQKELALGDQAYQAMLQNGEIVQHTPEAKQLAPVAAKLKRVADPLYGVPFSFYIDKSEVPNAFVVYGPRVYVDRGLIDFADSQEEVGGVLCHEMNHAIHHDGSNDDVVSTVYDTRTKSLVSRATAFLHGHFTVGVSNVVNFGENLIWKRHTRAEETAADLAGADLCAKAGINPWGLVWMFEKLEPLTKGSGPTFLSDHPATEKRIAALKHHFRQNPALFKHWSSDERTATPLRPA